MQTKNRLEIFGWAMYDFANSSYTTVVITAIYSSFFTRWIVPSDSTLRDSYWSIVIIVSTLIGLIAGPWIGAICDRTQKKKSFLARATLICSLATVMLITADPGDLYWALFWLILSNAAFMISESLVASFLPDIASKENMGLISGLGWGLGYFGGLSSLAMVMFLIDADEKTQLTLYIQQNQRAMLATGLFSLVASLPTFLFVRNRLRPLSEIPIQHLGLWQHIRQDFQHVIKVLRSLPQLQRFFFAFMLYMAGVEVVVKFVGIYATAELQMTLSDLTLMFLILQLSAAAGSLAFGILESKIGARYTINLGIAWWMVGILGVFFLQSLADLFALPPITVFYGIALIAGSGLGSIQSSSRAVVGILSPPEHAATSFGMWGTFARLGTILGMSYGFLADAISSRRFALLLVLGFFIWGAFIFRKVQIPIGANNKSQQDPVS